MKKKFLSITMVIIMLAVTLLPNVTVVATPNPGNITLTFNNERFDGTFKAYKVFSMSGDATTGYTYLIDPAFADFEFKGMSGLALREYMYLQESDTATLQDNEMRLLSEALVKYVTDKPVSPTDTVNSNNQTSVAFTGLDDGYYLIIGRAKHGLETDAPIVALFALASTDNPDPINISLKINNVPELDKEVNGEKWADVTIGSELDFKIETKVPKNIGAFSEYEFIINDTMSRGLTLVPNSYKITIATSTPLEITSVNAAANTNRAVWAVVPPGTPGLNPTGITVTFDKEYFATLPPDTEITVEYKAVLNSAASVTNPELNTVFIEYSNDPGGTGKGTTPEEEVEVFTNQIEIHKYTGIFTVGTTAVTGAGYLALAGATFVLSTSATKGTSSAYIPMMPGYRVAVEGETGDPNMTTGSSPLGRFTISGLGAGTYWLHELIPPTGGYNLLDAPIKIEIIRTEVEDSVPTEYEVEIKVNDLTQGKTDLSRTINVENNRGSRFPETGGIGRTIFIVSGIAIISLAFIALMVSKKKYREEEEVE